MSLLPIGSVVTLKNAPVTLMIIGRAQSSGNILYDYSACLFPEGYLNKDQLYVFNESDIDMLYYVGMQNAEEFRFRKVLTARMLQYREEQSRKETSQRAESRTDATLK